MKTKTKATQNTLETKRVEISTLGNGELDSRVHAVKIWDGFGPASKCAHCGDGVKQVDSFADSQTVRCIQCGRCALIKSSLIIRTVIPLVDFHLKRGSGFKKRPLDDLSMAEGLVECLRNDCWPSMATVSDFGIDTFSHLGALQSAHWAGCNVYDLDRVLGDGRAITQLIRAVPEQRYPDVEFFTTWDWLRLHKQIESVEVDA